MLLSRLHQQEGRGAGGARGPKPARGRICPRRPGDSRKCPHQMGQLQSIPKHAQTSQSARLPPRNPNSSPCGPPPGPPAEPQKRIGDISPSRRPDGVPKATPLDRAARGLSETCLDVSIRPFTAPIQHFRGRGAGTPGGRGTGPQGAKINFPENAPSTQGHAPNGQGTSRAFQNMFKRPDPPISRPKTTVSLLSSPPSCPSPRDKRNRGDRTRTPPQSSPQNSRAFRNMSGHPNSTICRPDTAASLQRSLGDR